MLNIASVNMPKIKPETKVLIIKTLKSKSPAEVADIFNASKWQVERIHKCYQETGDVHDRHGRPCKTTAWDDSLLVRLSKARPMSIASQLQEEWTPATPASSRTVRRILARSGLHGHIAAQKSAVNKRQQRNYVAYAKAHSLTEGWTAEKWQKKIFSDESSLELHPKRCQYYRRPSGAHLEPRFTQSNLEVERLCFGVTSNTEVPIQEICKVDGNINSAKYQQILASQYIPNYKRGQIFQQDGASCHTSGSTMKFLRGKKIKVLQGWPAQFPDMNIIEHMWGRMKEEAWRTNPKNLDELWDACKAAFHSIPDNFINKLCQTGWQLFCRPKEPIQDMNYLHFSPWWNTRLIFHLLFYELFEKDKMYSL